MQEVSARACEAFWLNLARKEIEAERLVEGLPVGLETLQDPRQRIDWDLFVALLDRFESLIGGPAELERAGERTLEEPSMLRLRKFGGLFVSVRQIYEYGGRWRAAAYYTHLERRFECLEDGRLRITVSIPAKLTGSEAFFRFRVGTLRVQPRWLGGSEDSRIEAEIGTHRGVYTITPPSQSSWLEQLSSVLRLPRSRRAAGPEAQGELQSIFEEIESGARALRDSEQRFRDLTDNLPQAFCVVSGDFTKLLYASPAHQAIYGCDPAEFKNPGAWLDYLHPDDRETLGSLYGKLLHEPRDGDTEYRIVRRDGELRWVKQHWNVVRDESGAVTRWVGLAEDVTERKRLEESVREAQKLEAVAKLAGGVAHDFNNLLTVILGDCEFLDQELMGRPGQLALVDEIRDAARRGATLADDLLALGRREAVAPRVIDLNELLARVTRLLRRVLTAEVELVAQPADELCPVEADPDDLERVLLNLASNARDAMPDGGTLKLTLQNVDISGPEVAEEGIGEPGAYVRLTVRDDGTGMDAGTLQRAFEPFFTTRKQIGGTGLGLCIVQGIVRQSDGEIRVDSEPGRGTCVSILLPRRTGDVEALEELPAPRMAAGGDETVLLVEDESPVRAVCARLLRGRGYRVLEARDGPEALALARGAERIDLVLTDIVMPGMSGLEVVERIAEMRPDARFLAISGYTGGETAQQGLARRGVSVVRKPFEPKALLAELRSVLDEPAR